MLTEAQLKEILTTQDTLGKREFDGFLKKAKEANINIEDYLFSRKIISQGNLYKAASNFFKLPYISLAEEKIRKDILFLIPEEIATAHRIIAFDKNEKELKIAALDPKDLEIFEFLGKKTNLDIKVFLTTPDDISKALKNYRKGLSAEFGISEKIEKTKGAQDGEDLKELAQDLPVIRIVDTLLEYAIFEKSSDIHIEPGEKDVNIRYRIDGILRNVMTLPKAVHAGIIARIKILANLKLDEHRLPQDGRFKIATKEYKVSFRVSIIPAFDGEKIVLRLLNEKAQLLTLEQLGFHKKPLEILKRNISKPHGMILVTGPTGSGKTTTLYTILGILNKPEVNIVTIEDPIEYHMAHVNQSQIQPKIGYTFAMGLRSFLRQDPDIIMVGEIRDSETAQIAAHAAMTGHLVLSTLHTNDAITTIPRLADMDVPSFLISSTTNIIIAQRLVRKICQKCIVSYTIGKKGIDEINKLMDVDTIFKVLERVKLINPRRQTRESLLFYHGKGCKDCNHSGYKGRIGIFEILEFTDKIQQLVIDNVNSDQIMKEALDEGMIKIIEDGFIKAKNGITTVEEVLRVTKE